MKTALVPVSAGNTRSLECLEDLEALEALNELEEVGVWGGGVERSGRAGGPGSLESLDDLEVLEALDELEEAGVWGGKDFFEVKVAMGGLRWCRVTV